MGIGQALDSIGDSPPVFNPVRSWRRMPTRLKVALGLAVVLNAVFFGTLAIMLSGVMS